MGQINLSIGVYFVTVHMRIIFDLFVCIHDVLCCSRISVISIVLIVNFDFNSKHWRIM